MKKFFSVLICMVLVGGWSLFAEDFETNGTRLTYEVQLTTEATVENRTDFPMYFAMGFWNNKNVYCPIQLFFVDSQHLQKIITVGQGTNDKYSSGYISCSYSPLDWCNSNTLVGNTHIIIKNITENERKLCENAKEGCYSTDTYMMFIWYIPTTNSLQPTQVLFVRCYNNTDYVEQ